VRGAARGDLLEVSLTQVLSKVVRAEIVRVLEPSTFRVSPDCLYFPECGGCDYRHISYEEELYAKLQCVNNALRRIGDLQVQVRDIIRTGRIDGYRNKAVLHSDGASLGFYKARSREIVPVEHCLLLKDDINAVISDLIHDGEASGDVTLRSGRNGVKKPLEEELDGLIFRLEAFFQVNTKAALLLFQKAREYAALSHDETLVDLYCGVGALTLFVGRDAGHALGVEQNADAVHIARENAQRNGLSHVKFLNADAAEWVSDLHNLDCVIVDPPRKGLSKGAVLKILELFPKRLVYISCNPATLARDLKELHSYTLRDICAVDMFPRTANIECCCLLERKLR